MIRRFFQRHFRGWVSRMADKYQSRPDKRRVHGSLTRLYNTISKKPGKKGPILNVDLESRIIIFSDQHKGAKDGSDDFALAERNYLAALDHYVERDFCYINLGDSEELWKNTLESVRKNNQASFEMEKQFLDRGQFVKIFGNHDLYWDNDPLAAFNLERIYGKPVKIYQGAILKVPINGKTLDIFLTHGHQGDLQSDGNWFSKWFVSTIWGRLQGYLDLNPNTPAYDDRLKTSHNRMMYEWSARQKDVLLITGHTHQAVFVSLTHLERLYRDMYAAKKAENMDAIKELEIQINARIREGDPVPDFKTYHPTYFNTGCCCFNDGDITGIEIEKGCIRLIKWQYDANNLPERVVLEEIALSKLLEEFNDPKTDLIHNSKTL